MVIRRCHVNGSCNFLFSVMLLKASSWPANSHTGVPHREALWEVLDILVDNPTIIVYISAFFQETARYSFIPSLRTLSFQSANSNKSVLSELSIASWGHNLLKISNHFWDCVIIDCCKKICSDFPFLGWTKNTIERSSGDNALIPFLVDDYFLSRLPIVEQRLAQGGVRLAATLNRIFASGPKLAAAWNGVKRTRAPIRGSGATFNDLISVSSNS